MPKPNDISVSLGKKIFLDVRVEKQRMELILGAL